jgi:hypothetical protein
MQSTLSGRGIYQRNVADIDSIIFHNPAINPANISKVKKDTLYILQSGNVVYQRKIVDIDRILFYNPINQYSSVTNQFFFF